MVTERTEREYIHGRCGGVTTVDGPEFEAMSNPLMGMVRTYCVQCEDYFELKEFAWKDTLERIPDYCRRHAQRASAIQHFLVSRNGMFIQMGIALILGAILPIVLGWGWILAIVLALCLPIVAMLINVLALTPWVLKRVYGTADCRMLD